MKWQVLITCPHFQSTVHYYEDLFKRHEIKVRLPRVAERLDESQLLEIIEPFHGVIAGDDRFTSRVLERAAHLKVIAKWGVGVDSIDLRAADRLGVRVFNTRDVFADEVADVVIGYIILLARQLHKIDQSVRSGEWKKIRGISLRGKKLGVIGVGSIGRAVIRRATATGMSVAGYDVTQVPGSFVEETGLRIVALEELLESADFISLNCSLTSSNYHMLGRNEFAIVKRGVYVVNTARGALIDESALIEALNDGRVTGAALDVFEDEPLALDSPLRRFDNCIFGAHNSSNTQEAVMRVNEIAIDNLLRGLGI